MKQTLKLILSAMVVIAIAIPLLALGFALLAVLLIITPFLVWYIKWRFFREVVDHVDEMRERTRTATTTLVEDEEGNVTEAEVIIEKKERR